jgi:hypothetical protein
VVPTSPKRHLFDITPGTGLAELLPGRLDVP